MSRPALKADGEGGDGIPEDDAGETVVRGANLFFGSTGAAQPPPAGPMTPAPHHVTVLSRRGCHLCEQACADVARIAGELGVPWEERDITDDDALMADHAEQVPVILVDGRTHDFWAVSESRLRAALTR